MSPAPDRGEEVAPGDRSKGYADSVSLTDEEGVVRVLSEFEEGVAIIREYHEQWLPDRVATGPADSGVDGGSRGAR